MYLKILNPKVYGGGDGFEEMMDDRDQFACYVDRERGTAPRGHWRSRMCAHDSTNTNRMFRESLQQQGHDGIIIKATGWDAPSKGATTDQFIVWNPGQIRSAFS